MVADSKHARINIVLRGRLADLASEALAPENAARHCKVWSDWPTQRLVGDTQPLVVFAYLHDLARERDLGSRAMGGHKRFILFQDDTPIESLAELLSSLDVRTPHRLHLARLEHDTERTFLYRFLCGVTSDDEASTIMDAWWDGDDLVVISPDFERLRVPGDRVPGLRNAESAERSRFEIDPYGAFLYWPGRDVHLGWSQLKQIVDPEAVLRARQQSERFNLRYGHAIRLLRQAKGLRQADIPGLDPRTVRRIEQGRNRATSKALKSLASAHGMDANTYMNELARHMKP